MIEMIIKFIVIRNSILLNETFFYISGLSMEIFRKYIYISILLNETFFYIGWIVDLVESIFLMIDNKLSKNWARSGSLFRMIWASKISAMIFRNDLQLLNSVGLMRCRDHNYSYRTGGRPKTLRIEVVEK